MADTTGRFGVVPEEALTPQVQGNLHTLPLNGCRRTRTAVAFPRISRTLALFIVVSASVGCSRGTPITIINESDVPLEDVVLSGSGFSLNVGSVGPHAEATVLVRSQGESDVRIHFTARGEAVSFGPDGYFEAGGGYVVTVTISPSLTMRVKSERAY